MRRDFAKRWDGRRGSRWSRVCCRPSSGGNGRTRQFLDRDDPRYRPGPLLIGTGGGRAVGRRLGVRISAARRTARVCIRGLRAFARSPRKFVADAERYLSHELGSAESASSNADVNGLPNVVPITFRVRKGSGFPHLNVVVPGMALWAMSGGPNTALNLTYRLDRKGVPVRYILTDVAAV